MRSIVNGRNWPTAASFEWVWSWAEGALKLVSFVRQRSAADGLSDRKQFERIGQAARRNIEGNDIQDDKRGDEPERDIETTVTVLHG